MQRVESSARDRLATLRATLSNRGDVREVFQALFPHGLEFIPDRTEDGARQIGRIRGTANLGVIRDADLVPIETRPQRALARVGPRSRGRAGVCAEVLDG